MALAVLVEPLTRGAVGVTVILPWPVRLLPRGSAARGAAVDGAALAGTAGLVVTWALCIGAPPVPIGNGIPAGFGATGFGAAGFGA